MAFYETTENGVRLLKSTLILCRHGFTTRHGGVSGGVYASLNLRENCDDAPENVRENYRRVAAAIGFSEHKIVFTRQVHGAEVRYAAEENSRELYTPIAYSCDGLYTDIRELPIVCFTADCVPVLLCDSENGVIAAVHCGWRSTVQDIMGAALGKMVSLGAKPENICAAIGPAIGACCFEVGQDVVDAMEQWIGAAAYNYITKKPDSPGKYLADLRGADKYRLESLGLKSENIDLSEECTMCSPDKYWSHRVTKGVRGNQAAFIVL